MTFGKKGTHRNIIAGLHDISMATASFLIAMMIRLGEDFSFSLDYITLGTPLFAAVSLGVLIYMRLYRGSWQYASMRDLMIIVRTATLIILVFSLTMFFITRMGNMPRSALLICWMLLLMLLGGPRFAYRAFAERAQFQDRTTPTITKIPVLLIGATDNAEQFIRDLIRNKFASYEVVAIVDNRDKMNGRTIHHVPVYADMSAFDNVIRKLERKEKRPQKIIVCSNQITGDELNRLFVLADQYGIPLARLPKMDDFKQGISDTLDIRPIAVEDLLGRSQNVLDRDAMQQLIENRTVLVTGAGGTIGGELTRQIASYHPSKLIILELSEYHLYKIEREMMEAFPDLPIEAVLCDVRDKAHVEDVFSKHTPDIVLHAAAIKHVPIAEFNIEEAVLTNVFGTRNIADACLQHNTSVMLMISTDKAVNPTNVMGASKRLAESFCQALGDDANGHSTKFITVRFGNVLGSTGSVVPLFQEQLAKGGPLTVTHEEMTRYFMTVREAVELVLQAAVLGVSMEDRKECIFVLDMGRPMKITELAEQMIRLAGYVPHQDIKIVYTGLRPGEKLYEELFHGGENVAKTSHSSIFLASPRGCDISSLRASLESLWNAASTRHTQETLNTLKELVPEFNHDPRYPAK